MKIGGVPTKCLIFELPIALEHEAWCQIKAHMLSILVMIRYLMI